MVEGTAAQSPSGDTLQSFLQQVAWKLGKQEEAEKWVERLEQDGITTKDGLIEFAQSRGKWHRYEYLPRAARNEIDLELELQGGEEDVPEVLTFSFDDYSVAPKVKGSENAKPDFSAQRKRRLSGVSKDVVNLLKQTSMEDVPKVVRSEMEEDELLQVAMEIGMNVDADVDEEVGEQFVKRAEEENCMFSAQELEWATRVLDMSQVIHAMAVARLYVCGKDSTEWKFTGLYGGAAIITESTLQMQCAHYIRLIDLDGWNPSMAVTMEQEMYKDFKYQVLNSFFHAWETNDGLAGLSFVSEYEAKFFAEKVTYCLENDPIDVIDELYEVNEKSFILVGENYARVANDDNARVRRKYAQGGIADGVEIKWAKPKPPPELANALGIDDMPASEPEEEKESAPAGLSNFADAPSPGQNVAWKRGGQQLKVDDASTRPKTVEECQMRIEANKAKIKKLQETKKMAKTAKQKEKADQIQGEIAQLETDCVMTTMEMKKFQATEAQTDKEKKGRRKSTTMQAIRKVTKL